MKPAGKWLGLAIVILSAAFFLLSLSGVIAIWLVNQPLTSAILGFVRPIISTLNATDAALSELDQSLSGIQGVVGEVKSLVESVELIQQFLPGLVDSVGNISASLENLEQNLGGSSDKLVEARDMLMTVEVNITRWIDLMTVGLSLLFLWIAFSQVSLFVHGWLYFTGTDLLGRRTQIQESGEPGENSNLVGHDPGEEN